MEYGFAGVKQDGAETDDIKGAYLRVIAQLHDLLGERRIESE